MEYLPSKKFIVRAIISILLIGGWFSYSALSGPKVTKIPDGTLENNGGIVVFSRNKGSDSSSLGEPLNWEDSETVNNGSAPTGTTINNTANISGATVNSSFYPIKLAELNTNDLNNIAGFQKYAKSLSSALKPYSYEGIPSELDMALEFTQTLDEALITKIDVLSQLHKVVGDTLLKIQVPDELGWRHLNLVNNSLELSYLDKQMSENLGDSKKMPEILARFQIVSKLFISSISDLNNFFADKKITFDDKSNIKINLRF